MNNKKKKYIIFLKGWWVSKVNEKSENHSLRIWGTIIVWKGLLDERTNLIGTTEGGLKQQGKPSKGSQAPSNMSNEIVEERNS